MKADDFRKLMIETDECILWEGTKTKGYGLTYCEKKNWRTHRLAWFLTYGSVPKHPVVLDHLCRNRACFNVKHLRSVSIRVNVLCGNTITANNLRKEECKNGHKLSKDNVRLVGGKKRKCKDCAREYNRATWMMYWRKRQEKKKPGLNGAT